MPPFKKGEPRPEKAGRKKGSINKIHKTVKDAVLATFLAVQDDPTHPANLTLFAKKHPRDFHVLAGKLIPSEVTAKISMIKVGADVIEETYEE